MGFRFGRTRLALPVLRAAEMRVQPLLLLAGERDARIEFGCGFDVPLREIDASQLTCWIHSGEIRTLRPGSQLRVSTMQ